MVSNGTTLDRSIFVASPDDLLRRQGDKLKVLKGQPLEASWLAWDLEEDGPFMDEAVVLEIGGQKLEIVCWKLGEVAVTWNRIPLNRRPSLVCEWGGDFQLEWRKNCYPALNAAIGKRINDVEVVEYRYETKVMEDRTNPENVGRYEVQWLLHGLRFVCDSVSFAVYNALDENGITLDNFGGPEFRLKSATS